MVALVVQALLGDCAYALRVPAVNAAGTLSPHAVTAALLILRMDVSAFNAAARSATARATAAVEAKKIGGACAPPTTTGPTVDGGKFWPGGRRRNSDAPYPSALLPIRSNRINLAVR